MKDSNITKEDFGKALKELMLEKEFEKIRVHNICEKCRWGRNSFYYHFKDKYDLINWIFDTEFLVILEKQNEKTGLELFVEVCEYFYENKKYYKNALCIEGQNSFSEHFRDVMLHTISRMYMDHQLNNFQLELLTDIVILAFNKWIIGEVNITADEFVNNIKELQKKIEKE